MSFKLAVVQMDCVLGDVAANLERADSLVAAAAAQGATVTVLPELATTGYFVGERLGALAESIPGPTTDELGQIARRHQCYVVAGMIETGKDCYYNSSALLAPDGSLHGAYRKVHLFSAEREAFTPGAEPALFDIAGTRVALTICYDLIFPEYIRRLVLEGAHVILNSTDWITNDWQRSLGWGGNVVAGLVATRALENTVHVAMADRVGVEEGWKSLGHSCIAAPSGAHLAKIDDGEGVAVAALELDHPDWQQWRTIATYLDDRQPDLYIPDKNLSQE